MLPALNFPQYNFRLRKNSKGSAEIFDRVRKKFVALTPEEWVRQHLVEFLVEEKNFPSSLLSVEKQMILNHTNRRTDLVAYNNSLQPLLIAECKAPGVPLDQAVLDQALRYNLVFNLDHLIITNGLRHYYFLRDGRTMQWTQGMDFPDYAILLKQH